MGERAEVIYGSVRIELGDRRLEQRVRTLVAALAEQPEASLPQAGVDWAAQQAAYRLFANEAVDPAVVSEGLGRATAERCVGEGRVLVVQDTTSLDYTGHRATRHLGVLEHPKARGVLLHSCLAVSEGGVPLGLLDVQPWTRTAARSATKDDTRHTDDTRHEG